MKRLVLLFIFSLIANISIAQYGHKLPYACELITAANLNTLLGTILKLDTSALPGTSCTFRTADNGAEITIAYQTLKDAASAEARLKQSADSNTIEIANAKPTIPYTSINYFEPAGKSANVMIGKDELRGPIARTQFTLDKYLLTFETSGIPPEKVRESLPEIYKIIKQNSGVQ